MTATKIATCCYCGTRAALVLRGKDRHELSCRNCGAPLRNLKSLQRRPDPSREPKRHSKAKNHQAHWHDRPRKQKARKPRARRVMSQIWDVVEDVFDEVFD